MAAVEQVMDRIIDNAGPTAVVARDPSVAENTQDHADSNHDSLAVPGEAGVAVATEVPGEIEGSGETVAQAQRDFSPDPLHRTDRYRLVTPGLLGA